MTGLLGLQSILSDFLDRLKAVVRRFDRINSVISSVRISKKDAPCHPTIDDGQNRTTMRMSSHRAVPRIVGGPAAHEAVLVDHECCSIEQVDRQR